MNQDLHKLRAAAIFNVDYEDVTEKQRQYAKTVNFYHNYFFSGRKSVMNMDKLVEDILAAQKELFPEK